MSYQRRRGLGQAKWVPGQISFSTLPEGATALPSLQPLVERGLPIAPYIEHGSYATGRPAIMRYGLDPYRGIMGLGQGVLTEYACSESALNASWQERQRATLKSARNASMAAGALVGGLGALAGEKNSFFGALGGAAAAFVVQHVWLAPHSAT